MLNEDKIRNNFSKPGDCYEEENVASEFENKGLIRLEEKIYGKYLNKPGASVLDVGCFVGRVSFPLAQEGFNVFGVDIASSGIVRANKLKKNNKVKNVHFAVASATDIPYQDKSFDYILFPYNTIENIPLEELRINAMQEAGRVIKNDGLILFSAHNRYYPKYFLGILVFDILRLLVKTLKRFKLDNVLPNMSTEFVKQIVSSEYGSLLWVEVGGKKYTKCFFSRLKDIKKLLRLSSLELITSIPVMVHDPRQKNADVLNNSFHSIISAPIFYYIARKENKKQ